MQFPVIEHLDQVREAIKGRDEFYIRDNGTHFIVNYHVNFDDTFPNPSAPGLDAAESCRRAILRECRGITFDSNGRLIRRPFQKFFNYAEKPDEHPDLSEDHHILEKLDGSMIAPFVLNGEIIYGTKMGFTEVARPVSEFAASLPQYRNLVMDFHALGFTPIMEWTSRKQRIVLDYPTDQLTLTAVRHLTTGNYLNYNELLDIGASYNIPVVKAYGKIDEIKSFLEKAAAVEDIEGYVVRFHNGHQFKVKGNLYLLLHKTLDNIQLEKNTLRLILEQKIDDALPLLADDVKTSVDEYSHSLYWAMNETIEMIWNVAKSFNGNKKEFALHIMNDPSTKPYSSFLFTAFDATDKEQVYDRVVNHLIAACSTSTKIDQNRFLINGLRWETFYHRQPE